MENAITRSITSIFHGMKEPKNGSFEAIEPGSYIARCVSIVDLGTQIWESGQYGKQERRKIFITWELPTEKRVFDTEKGEEPFFVSKEYSLSMWHKAQLRIDLERWRGKQFTEEEIENFDESKIVGVPCMLNIIPIEKNGKTYANIQGVMQVPKGMKCPPQIKPTVIFSLNPDEEGKIDMDVFEKLPDFLKEKIKKSPEFQKIVAPMTDVPVELFPGDVDMAHDVPDIEYGQRIKPEDLPF